MVKQISEDQPKPVRWVGSSKEDLSEFPLGVRRRVGGALWERAREDYQQWVENNKPTSR
jgi:phage-related protein